MVSHIAKVLIFCTLLFFLQGNANHLLPGERPKSIASSNALPYGDDATIDARRMFGEGPYADPERVQLFVNGVEVQLNPLLLRRI